MIFELNLENNLDCNKSILFIALLLPKYKILTIIFDNWDIEKKYHNNKIFEWHFEKKIYSLKIRIFGFFINIL